MALKDHKPKTPSLRHTVLIDNSKVSNKKMIKSLLKKNAYKAGRSKGRITVRHKGGQVKRRYRIIDFKRDKKDIPAEVIEIQYDPNRNANIALLKYKDGEWRYIIAAAKLEIGMKVIASDDEVPYKAGNATEIGNIQTGIKVHNIELHKGEGAKLCRAAGSSAIVMGGEGNYVQVKMPSGEIRLVYKHNYATIGEVGNADIANVKLGKAGRKRYKGIRPTVRGQVMGAHDHPHGGGESKHRVGGQRKDVYGNRTDKKTRKNKKTNKFIVSRRKTKRRKQVKKLN